MFDLPQLIGQCLSFFGPIEDGPTGHSQLVAVFAVVVDQYLRVVKQSVGTDYEIGQ